MTKAKFDAAKLHTGVEALSRQLDLVNLELAKYRVEHGMSTALIDTYATMGAISRGIRLLLRATKDLPYDGTMTIRVMSEEVVYDYGTVGRGQNSQDYSSPNST